MSQSNEITPGTGVVHPEQPHVSRWRTLIRVVSVEEDEEGEKVVRAIVPGWDPNIEITFPANIMPEDIQGNLRPGLRFHATVNLAAEEGVDLHPDMFEVFPPPDSKGGLE